jgi:hypothetical protein
MPITPIQPVIAPPKKGGGALGSIAGTIGGGAIGFIASGGNPAGAMAGASLGSQLGGAGGEAIDPAQAGSQSPHVGTMEKSKPIASVTSQPDVQLAMMQNSKNLLKSADVPDALDYMSLIDQASAKLKKQMGVA